MITAAEILAAAGPVGASQRSDRRRTHRRREEHALHDAEAYAVEDATRTLQGIFDAAAATDKYSTNAGTR